jgi:lipoprotein-anchoring transpeptidase ErfK/SrfK
MGAKVSRRTDPYAGILRRILLVTLATAPLTACNTVQSEPPKLAAVAANDSAASLVSKLPDGPHQSPPISQPKRPPHLARQIVAYEGGEQPGTVLVRTSERRLYLVLADGQAIRYPVGSASMATSGKAGPKSRANTLSPPGRLRPRSNVTARVCRTSSRAARPGTRWGLGR